MTIYFWITLLAIAFGISWVQFLTNSGEVFDFVRSKGERIVKNRKLRKLLWACEKCVAGQFALWIGAIYPIIHSEYVWEYHISAVIFSIFFTGIIAKYVE